jgi:hypothetical protein
MTAQERRQKLFDAAIERIHRESRPWATIGELAAVVFGSDSKNTRAIIHKMMRTLKADLLTKHIEITLVNRSMIDALKRNTFDPLHASRYVAGVGRASATYAFVDSRAFPEVERAKLVSQAEKVKGSIRSGVRQVICGRKWGVYSTDMDAAATLSEYLPPVEFVEARRVLGPVSVPALPSKAATKQLPAKKCVAKKGK